MVAMSFRPHYYLILDRSLVGSLDHDGTEKNEAGGRPTPKIKALRKSKMSKKGRGGTGYFRLLLLLLQQELGTGPPTVLESSSFLKCMVA